jgi:hypothetical protein
MVGAIPYGSRRDTIPPAMTAADPKHPPEALVAGRPLSHVASPMTISMTIVSFNVDEQIRALPRQSSSVPVSTGSLSKATERGNGLLHAGISHASGGQRACGLCQSLVTAGTEGQDRGIAILPSAGLRGCAERCAPCAHGPPDLIADDASTG